LPAQEKNVEITKMADSYRGYFGNGSVLVRLVAGSAFVFSRATSIVLAGGDSNCGINLCSRGSEFVAPTSFWMALIGNTRS
jgi:hypothetical protein